MLEIEVFSDVVCPWCYVGTTRLERALDESGARDKVHVRYRPFLLDPMTPPEGTDVPSMLRAKYGVDPKMLWRRCETEAKKSGLDLDLSKQPRSYPTLRAQTLLRLAEDKGTQSALARALFAANFDEAKNISDPPVLVDIASNFGFTRDEAQRALADPNELDKTRAEALQAARMGVTGVPLFVFGELGSLSGAQPEAVFQDVLRQAMMSVPA